MLHSVMYNTELHIPFSFSFSILSALVIMCHEGLANLLLKESGLLFQNPFP